MRWNLETMVQFMEAAMSAITTKLCLAWLFTVEMARITKNASACCIVSANLVCMLHRIQTQLSSHRTASYLFLKFPQTSEKN